MNTKLKYFKILGISPTTNQSEIKKAYRKLAFKYHPDKNTSPEANQLFIQLTDAYEIVSGLKKTPQRNFKNNSKNTPTSTKHEREQRIKAAKERYKRAKQKEKEEEINYFKTLTSGLKWTFIKWIGIIGLLLSTTITLDFLLPPIKNKTLLKELYTEQRSNYISININENSNYFNHKIQILLINNPLIEVESTPIFNDVKKIIITDYYANKIHAKPSFSMTSIFPFLTIILLLPIFTFFYKKQHPFFSFMHMLSLYFIPVIILIVLLSNWRIFKIFI